MCVNGGGDEAGAGRGCRVIGTPRPLPPSPPWSETAAAGTCLVERLGWVQQNLLWFWGETQKATSRTNRIPVNYKMSRRWKNGRRKVSDHVFLFKIEYLQSRSSTMSEEWKGPGMTEDFLRQRGGIHTLEHWSVFLQEEKHMGVDETFKEAALEYGQDKKWW